MATIVTDNFNSYTDGDINGQGSWTANGNFDVQGAITKEGNKAIKANDVAPVQSTYCTKIGTLQSAGTQGVYVMRDAANGWFDVQFIEGATTATVISFNTFNNITLRTVGAVDTVIQAYAQRTWYWVELEWRGTGATSEVRVKINDSAWSIWYEPNNDWTAGLDTFEIYNQSQTSGVSYFDYVAENPLPFKIENFTTYTEVDPVAYVSKTTSRVTAALMPRTATVYVYSDKGVNHFSGDFEHLATVNTLSATGSLYGVNFCWSLANSVGDAKAIIDASGSMLAVVSTRVNGTIELHLREIDSGTSYDTYSTVATVFNTSYYLKIKRDESVGTYGTLYCYIYSDVGRLNLIDTLSLTLHTSKKDFRYIYSTQSYNDGWNAGRGEWSGYLENLDLQELPVTSENFTTYTEVDPDSHITVIPSRSSFVDLTKDESAYVYNDKGINHFSGDFEHLITVYLYSGSGSNSQTVYWALTNLVGDKEYITGEGGDMLNMEFLREEGGAVRLYIQEVVGGSTISAPYIGIDAPYLCYLKIRREEAVGTYGTLYCNIYSDSARTVLVNTLTITLSANKDFRYIYATQTYDQGVGDRYQTGYSENFDLQEPAISKIVTSGGRIKKSSLTNKITSRGFILGRHQYRNQSKARAKKLGITVYL